MPGKSNKYRKPAVNSGGRRYAKVREAAAYIGVTERTVHTMLDDGRLTRFRLGPRVLRIDLNEVDAVMGRETGGAA
jgi:excisionase family DNA binding protein